MVEKKRKSERELLQEINEKLDKLLTLSAIQNDDVDKQIENLHYIGWEWDKVAKFVGMTNERVRKRYSRKKTKN